MSELASSDLVLLLAVIALVGGLAWPRDDER